MDIKDILYDDLDWIYTDEPKETGEIEEDVFDELYEGSK